MRRAFPLAPLLLAAACSGNGGGGGDASGRVEIEIVIPADVAADPFAGVDAYRITVRSGALVLSTAWFGASDPLEIEDIAPGTGYTVGLEGFTGPARISRGRTVPFDFVEGTTTNARMYFAKAATFNTVRNPSSAPARSGASAAMFSDGTVLLAGGQVAGTAVATADLYFPDTDRILPATGTMEAPHAYAVTVRFGDRALVAGGIDAAGNPTAAADVFEYQTASSAGFWIAGVPDMSTARRDAGGGRLTDDAVIVAGGEAVLDTPLDTAELFRFTASPGAWSAAPALTEARRGPVSFEVAAGQVIIGGGYDAVGGGGNVYNQSADRYSWNGSSATQAVAANLGTSRERAGLAPLGGYDWLIFGGENQTGLLNAVNSIASTGTNFTSANEPNLGTAQRRGGGMLLGDGRVLLAGGDSGTGTTITPVDRLLEYNPASGVATPVTPTLGPTATAVAFDYPDGTSVVVIDGRILRYSPDAP